MQFEFDIFSVIRLQVMIKRDDRFLVIKLDNFAAVGEFLLFPGISFVFYLLRLKPKQFAYFSGKGI